MNFKISLFFKGMLMGIAEIIPGVSGGTLAVAVSYDIETLWFSCERALSKKYNIT